jgi:hypothetical protein
MFSYIVSIIVSISTTIYSTISQLEYHILINSALSVQYPTELRLLVIAAMDSRGIKPSLLSKTRSTAHEQVEI